MNNFLVLCNKHDSRVHQFQPTVKLLVGYAKHTIDSSSVIASVNKSV